MKPAPEFQEGRKLLKRSALRERSWLDKLRAVFASFAFRFMMRYVIGLSVAVLLVMVMLYGGYSYQYFREHEHILGEQLAVLVERAERGEDLGEVSSLPQQPVRGRTYFLLVDPAGRKLAGNLDGRPPKLHENWWEMKAGTLFGS
ncbi:MAG: hypothetical protein RBR77_01025, partial [Thauera sp.]|nr:hypothetical protein [Thauera sp.]